MGREKATKAYIIKVLADPTYKTRQEQADALGIDRVSLWDRLKKHPDIEKRVKELVDEETANTVAKGFQRFDRIITSGSDGDAIKAMRLLLEYRGELNKQPSGSEDDPIHYRVHYNNADS